VDGRVKPGQTQEAITSCVIEFGGIVAILQGQYLSVIARSEATKQSSLALWPLDCFAPLAMTEL
jgi:hypothetical protein